MDALGAAMHQLLDSVLALNVGAWACLPLSVAVIVMVARPKNRDERGWQIFGKAGISPEVKQVSKNLIALDALAQADYATTIIPSKQASDALRRRGWYYFDPRYSVPYTFCVATLKHAYISMAAQKLLDMLYELRGTF